MRASILLTVLFVVALAGGCTSLPRADTTRAQAPTADPEPAKKNCGEEPDQDKNGKEKDKSKEGPKHIRDNAFLVEEAYNQEPGDAQHIFNWINFWDRTPEGRTRNFAGTYTLEVPLGSQQHQFSFTTLFLTSFDQPNKGPVKQTGDVGDTFLNYRYQLLADDDFVWMAPRFSVILPIGDKRLGSGTGEVGYQFNLPVSRYGEDFDFHFNAGATLVPHVTAILDDGTSSPSRNLHVYNVGASAFWKPETYLHFFVEVLALSIEAFDDRGVRESATQVFVNPGVRYAICQLDEVEWVIGVSVPIGVTKDTPDIGVFGYMSVEHVFRKKDEDGGKD